MNRLEAKNPKCPRKPQLLVGKRTMIWQSKNDNWPS